MERTATTIAAALLSLSIGGISIGEASAGEATLEITVNGVVSGEGQIAIAVFADAENYESGVKPTAAKMVAATEDGVSVTITGLRTGPCAIKVFHDVNGNGELDTNLLGIPTEPYGFSNNAVARFGPPGFSAAQFELTKGDNAHLISLDN